MKKKYRKIKIKTNKFSVNEVLNTYIDFSYSVILIKTNVFRKLKFNKVSRDLYAKKTLPFVNIVSSRILYGRQARPSAEKNPNLGKIKI